TGPAPGGRSGGRDDEGGPATASGGRAGGKDDTGATASTPGGRTGGKADTGATASAGAAGGKADTGATAAAAKTGADSASGVSKGGGGSAIRQAILAEAEKYIGARPYESPPKIPNSFDCSGFVNYIYTLAAQMPLSTSSSGYASIGTKIDFKDAQPGDVLVFVSTPGGTKLDHVAILYKKSDTGELRGSQVIHAVSIAVQSAAVKGSSTSPGIVISELGKRGDGVWQNEYFLSRYVYTKRFID
ncbi:MAG: C40 family peptidase, partial [Spirochaetaceae bacterium]|nr:C40 family peptidase [Spirochaetaceae bacterium]